MKIYMSWDFLGSGPVVENLPSNAGDASSIPGQGAKIPHAAGQLSPSTALENLCATTIEPASSRAHTPQQEKPIYCKETWCSQK